MKGGVRLYLVGIVLLALAGCGRGLWQYGERAPWRQQAEVACLKSGAVKLGTGVVQIQPIEGPGMCGADFPLKVALLGENSAMSYADDLRPPGAIPVASSPEMPNWPLGEPYYARPASVQTQPARGETLRWVPGPPAIEQPRHPPTTDQSHYAPTTDEPRYAPPMEQPRSVPATAPAPPRAPVGPPMSI